MEVPLDEELGVEPEQQPPPMDETEIQSLVRNELQDAANYVDEHLSPLRKRATDDYMGRGWGDEEDGRSQVVSQDTRDTVQAILPSLMRIFTGAERAVEYIPRGPEDVGAAEQATDYANYVFYQENPGFLTLHSWFKDALIRKVGIVKWWHEEVERVETYTYTGVGDEPLAALVSTEGVEVVGHEEVAVPGPAGPERAHDVTIRRRWLDKNVRVAAVPPEEFLIERNARSIDDARVVAHRSKVYATDLVAMGYDKGVVDDAISHTDELSYNQEARSRRIDRNEWSDDTDNDALAPVLYTEAYMRLDMERTGIAELHKVCCIGEEYEIVNIEPTDDIPFADLCPDPEPHTFWGLSVHDIVEDIQRIKSQIMRAVLDSLVQSVNPRTAVVVGQVNLEDVLNNEVGAVIRQNAPGMVQPFQVPFVGAPGFQALAYMDEVKEGRTGQNKSSLGLEADALQSTTRSAVQAQMQAAQQRIELIARIFAETGMKRLFRGILRLIVRHQDKRKMVRLRNEWVPIDPLVWDANMDVRVNVALGLGSNEDRVMRLQEIAGRQEQILQTLGPQNEMVTLGQYNHTLRTMTELSGHKDVGNFWNELPIDFVPEPPPPQPDPAVIIAEAEKMKNEAHAQLQQAELQLKQWEAQAKDDRERDYNEARIMIEAAKLGISHQAAVAQMQRNRGTQ